MGCQNLSGIIEDFALFILYRFAYCCIFLLLHCSAALIVKWLREAIIVLWFRLRLIVALLNGCAKRRKTMDY